jgi:hypothetical protein
MEALGGNTTFNWNQTGIPDDGKVWKMPNQGKIDWVQKGATFTIERSGDSPTANSQFYMLFGRVEIVMKVATGTGIISSAILQSEALDEIDWEFRGSNSTILTNYFGKGDTSTYDRGKDYDLDFSPQEDFHNYTIDWTKDRIQWWVDGKMVRELLPKDAQNGTRYPQTPMNIRLGSWAAGDPSKNDPGVVEWAGGKTDYSQGPYTMTIQSVYAQDYTKAAKYSWDGMDGSGDWQKVKVIEYVSALIAVLNTKLTDYQGQVQSPRRNRIPARRQEQVGGSLQGREDRHHRWFSRRRCIGRHRHHLLLHHTAPRRQERGPGAVDSGAKGGGRAGRVQVADAGGQVRIRVEPRIGGRREKGEGWSCGCIHNRMDSLLSACKRLVQLRLLFSFHVSVTIAFLLRIPF